MKDAVKEGVAAAAASASPKKPKAVKRKAEAEEPDVFPDDEKPSPAKHPRVEPAAAVAVAAAYHPAAPEVMGQALARTLERRLAQTTRDVLREYGLV